ncbi:hypothetical protein [Aliiroseovarius sp.]|uniref:hypothetical protein n=1 Tax=Aliiroseovarius sp. TaxID=1872442 RepID=UPI002615AC96|nr:hypothetical protein [Aliiroseovarius sp.]
MNEVPPSGGKELLRDTEYKWDILLKNGFSYLGDWEEDGAGEMRLERQAPDAPGVYAFVVGEEVVYVGKTSRTLRARMADYRRGHYRQRTSAAVKRQIGEVLRQGTGVRVLVATPPDGLWNGLPIVTLHGLEAGLIQLLTPLWNRQGKG